MPDGYWDTPQGQAQLKKQQEEYAKQQAEQRARQNAADQQWKKFLQQDSGGKVGDAGFTTNFEGAAGYDALKAMIEHADPSAMMTASTHWTAIAGELKATAAGLASRVNGMLEHWSGASAEAFAKNASDLQTSLTNGSQYATRAGKVMGEASGALSEAQGSFPGDPGTLSLAKSWLKGELGMNSDVAFHNDAEKYGLSQALAMDGGQLSARERAHQQAVLVMQTLGTKYNHATAQLVGSGGKGGPVGVWPPPPPTPTPGPPVGSPGNPNPAPPNQGGNVAVKPITGGGVNSGAFTPGVNNGGSVLPGAGGVGGVHGGQFGGNGVGVGGKLDGISGGLHSGVEAGGGLGAGGGFGGVGGLGVGGGAGGAGLGGGGLVGMSGLGASGLTGGAGSGSAAGEAGGVGEGAMAAGEGEGAAGAGGEGGMGAGGLGGLANAAGKKKQRKGRADYLVEDEGTWEVDTPVNPGVITL